MHPRTISDVDPVISKLPDDVDKKVKARKLAYDHDDMRREYMRV